MNPREREKARGLTLREFYEQYYVPNFLCEAKPKTFKAYANAIDHWETLTNNPRLFEIESQTLARYKALLRDPEADGFDAIGSVGLDDRQATLFDMTPEAEPEGEDDRPHSKATVNKCLRHVRAMLRKAGPAWVAPDALGILDSVPYTKPLRESKRLPKKIKTDVVSLVYLASVIAKYPKIDGVLPEHWWKALIVTASIEGFRRGGLLALKWEDVDWSERVIRLPAEGDKCDSDREKPMNEVVLQHLMRIRSSHELVFPFYPSPHSESTFYRQWWRIQDHAGLEGRNRIKLHDLKRFCATTYAKSASPWAVKQILDHSTLDTSLFYANAVDEVREAVDNLPLPSVFVEEFSSATA